MFAMPSVHVGVQAFFKQVVAQHVFDRQVGEGRFAIGVVAVGDPFQRIGGGDDGEVFFAGKDRRYSS